MCRYNSAFKRDLEYCWSACKASINSSLALLPDKTIDSSYLRNALNTVGRHARPGSTVVFESSVVVGMTRQLLGPLGAARRFFVGMSPEVRDSLGVL
jgi:UDP-N-acetyl-D-mannosaminuronate dehydrogenase